jgi:hypothetical protein
MGQRQMCFGIFGDDRNKIHYPTRQIWDREKLRWAGFDPLRLRQDRKFVRFEFYSPKQSLEVE